MDSVKGPRVSGQLNGALEGRNVSHRYASGGRLVLDNVSLHVPRGEFVSLVGSSGCGKTTFLSVLCGTIEPSRGSVLVNGKDVTGVPSIGRGMVFQGDRLFPWRTALRNVTFPLELRGESSKVARKKAVDVLKLVGLGQHVDSYPSQLSGGMRQRVNVARALVVEPDFLLMDEPFASLDAQTREVMQVELLRILGSSSAGVVFVTHQIDEALLLSDRVVVIVANPGRIARQIPVPFDRPRERGIKRDREFQALSDEIWKQIEGDVMAGADVRVDERETDV
jgi:ABC-type nitrate/sulfonate/bicarbonate transport system ATPase subunit